MGNAEVGAMVGVPPPTPQLVSMRDYRGDTLLQPFRMRERFQNKKPMMGFGMGLNSPEVARWVRALRSH